MVLKIRADFTERVVVLPDTEPWVPSPIAGVERQMLDRVGDEVARATSVVRFSPGIAFPAHVHGGGEEFFVLQGTFLDEEGEYPLGSYVRNPIGTGHAPRAGADGATLFVKLQQFATSDAARVDIRTTTQPWLPGSAKGLSVLPLHQHDTEHVALVRWAPNTHFNRHSHWGGEEILVISGVLHDEHGTYPAGSWLRSPHLSAHEPFTKAEGATLYVKVGHLPQGSQPPSA